MSSERLNRALQTGLIELPDGVLGLWNAPADIDVRGDAVAVSQGFAPAYAQLKARNLPVTPEPEGPVAASIVFCHRAKEATLALLAHALDMTAPGGLIALDGAKTDGIDSLLKSLRKVVSPVEAYSKAHGKLVWFTHDGTCAPDEWRPHWQTIEGDFQTWPGIFSADGIDPGSRLLTQCLPPLKGQVADFGAGWGYLSRHVLAHSPDLESLDLIEADWHAVQAATRNVTDPRATVQWGDATRAPGPYDAVICNPPFHISRKPDPAVGRAFIHAAARALGARGTLWMVANRTLPYESTLAELFRKVETVDATPGFKVLKAEAPVPAGQVGKSTARHRR